MLADERGRLFDRVIGCCWCDGARGMYREEARPQGRGTEARCRPEKERRMCWWCGAGIVVGLTASGRSQPAKFPLLRVLMCLLAVLVQFVPKVLSVQ